MTVDAIPLLSVRSVRAVALGACVAVAVVVVYTLTTGPSSAASTSLPGGSTGEGVATAGVEVVGTGKVEGTPDVLRLDLVVTTTRPDASGSLAATSASARKVLRALRSRDVKTKDIKTANLSLQPDYDYSEERQTIKGYTASQQISVVLRDLDKAGALIGSATSAGGNATRIQGLALDLEEDSNLLAAARAAAISDARGKAETYAKAAGRTLGAVTVISENTTSPPPVHLDGRLGTADERAADVPIEPGSQQVSVSVRVVWSFA